MRHTRKHQCACKKRHCTCKKCKRRKSVRRRRQQGRQKGGGAFTPAVAFTGSPWTVDSIGDRNYYPLNPYTSGDERPQLQDNEWPTISGGGVGAKRRSRRRRKRNQSKRKRVKIGGGSGLIESIMYDMSKTMSTLRGEAPGPDPDPTVQPSTRSILTDGRAS